jgi:hypothetical protein
MNRSRFSGLWRENVETVVRSVAAQSDHLPKRGANEIRTLILRELSLASDCFRKLLMPPIQFHGWPALTPTGLLVPELDALYHPVGAAQIQWARLTAGPDCLAKLQFFIGTIAEVHDDALKSYRRLADPNL